MLVGEAGWRNSETTSRVGGAIFVVERKCSFAVSWRLSVSDFVAYRTADV